MPRSTHRYIPTQEGWLYLSTVIDLYSRKVVGWSMSDRLKAELVNNALLMAIWKRKPSQGLIWHTDQSSQYASHSHRKILKQHQLIQSMSRKGNGWDNAVAESFFHTLKTELTHHRRHSALKKQKPYDLMTGANNRFYENKENLIGFIPHSIKSPSTIKPLKKIKKIMNPSSNLAA